MQAALAFQLCRLLVGHKGFDGEGELFGQRPKWAKCRLCLLPVLQPIHMQFQPQLP